MIALTGLQAHNPIAYLAALGLVRLTQGRLGWRAEHAVMDAWPEQLTTLAQQRLQEPPLSLPHDTVKVTPSEYAQLPPEWAAAWGSIEVLSERGEIKTTAMDLTFGQTKLLAAIRTAVAMVTPARVEETLLGPWHYTERCNAVGWDAATGREYAYEAKAPTASGTPMGMPVAVWLAWESLPFWVTWSSGERLRTVGWQRGVLTYRTWTPLLNAEAIRCLLTLPKPVPGILRTYHAQMTPAKQGGGRLNYGSPA